MSRTFVKRIASKITLCLMLIVNCANSIVLFLPKKAYSLKGDPPTSLRYGPAESYSWFTPLKLLKLLLCYKQLKQGKCNNFLLHFFFTIKNSIKIVRIYLLYYDFWFGFFCFNCNKIPFLEWLSKFLGFFLRKYVYFFLFLLMFVVVFLIVISK